MTRSISRFIFLFSFSLTTLIAPFGFGQSEEGSSGNFGFRSAGVSIGWYNPGMDYWNSTYFPDHQWENRFHGSFSYSVFGELRLIQSLQVKLSGSFYTENVKSGIIPMGDVTGNEQLKTNLTFFSLDGIYSPDFLKFERFSPYAGIGISFVLVQNKLTREPIDSGFESYTNKGQDVTGTIIAGIERSFGKYLALGADFRYVIGNYKQEMKDQGGAITTHPVSLNGPMIGLNIAYLFN